VQRKNRHTFTARLGYVIDRESPARGCRHLVTKRDVRDFVELIPEWPAHCIGIEKILLGRGGRDLGGLYVSYPREKTGTITLDAWDGDLWRTYDAAYFAEHWHLFARLGVAHETVADGVECRFTEAQARAFLLLHVFLHELGHHVDRMRSAGQRDSKSGEPYAERFANDLLETMWPRYVDAFGNPTRA
jgi:hypothetical protein